MEKQQEDLHELLELTEATLKKVKTIDSKMEDNRIEDMVEIQILFDKRQEVIDRLEASKIRMPFNWATTDLRAVKKLQAMEHQLNASMNNLYQAFNTQMNRISQTKQISKKYRGTYQSASADGTFLDIRK